MRSWGHRPLEGLLQQNKRPSTKFRHLLVCRARCELFPSVLVGSSFICGNLVCMFCVSSQQVSSRLRASELLQRRRHRTSSPSSPVSCRPSCSSPRQRRPGCRGSRPPPPARPLEAPPTGRRSPSAAVFAAEDGTRAHKCEHGASGN